MLGACATGAEELLPIPASIRGASRVDAVEVTVRGAAVAAVAATDERTKPDAPSVTPFRQMLARTVETAAHDAGLTAGRPLKLLVEIDELAIPGAGGALLGRRDRLAGSVFVTDAASGEPLGHLYVDVVNANGGLVRLALRGGNVREALAEEFARRVADALGGRKR